MNLPFTAEQFLEVFARYNQAVWPMQVFLNSAGLFCVSLLFVERAWASRMIALLLAGLWLWAALAYHYVFLAALNVAAWWFGILFALGAMLFDWFGVVHDRLRFHLSGGAWQIAGAILIVWALAIYPATSRALGHRYPVQPTFGSPCPTTIFTIGMLLFAEAPVPRAVFIVPLLWSAIGSLAALWLGMVEDFSLLAAGVIGFAAALFLHGAHPLTFHARARRALHS